MTTAWPEVALGEVCLITMGQAPSGESYNSEGDGWPLISGAGDFHNGLPKAKKFTSVKTKLCEPGDIVLGIRASIGSKVLADKIYCLGRGVAGLRASVDLEERYLWHWLDAVAEDLAAQGRGATFKQVNKNDVAELKIPLPPLDEQRRIAAILDKADEVRAKRKAALETLETLSQAIFIEMFGDPVTNPMGWPIMLLGDLAEFLDSQRRPITASDRIPGPIPYYGANGQQDSVADFIFDEPLLLLAEDGGYFDQPERGVAYAIEGKSWVNNHAHVLRPKDQVTLPFLTESLRTRDLSALLTGSTRAKLTKAGAIRIPVALPPLKRQHEFSHARSQISLSHRAVASGVEAMDELFFSLQQKAFQGAL